MQEKNNHERKCYDIIVRIFFIKLVLTLNILGKLYILIIDKISDGRYILSISLPRSLNSGGMRKANIEELSIKVNLQNNTIFILQIEFKKNPK